MQHPLLVHFTQETAKILQFLQDEFRKLQTGRANPALIEHITIEAYGQNQELRTVAGISVPDARTMSIQPWDRAILQNIEKAMQQANLGVGITNDGTVVRVTLPPMTQERRTQLTKIVHERAEDARIQVRKVRQTTQDQIKAEKDEDVRDTLLKELQKAVDDANTKIGDSAKKKEEEVMKI